MEEWQQGEVIENIKWTSNLASLKIKADIMPHQAGQFTKIGLKVNDNLITRAYSYASAPDEKLLEIIYINIPTGTLSPKLHQLKKGDKIQIMKQATGYFTMEEVPDGKNLWMIATGTALGVFLALLKTDLPWQRFKKIVLIHGVSYSDELIYQDLIQELNKTYPNQLTYIRTVTRDKVADCFNYRIPIGIESRDFQSYANIEINEDSQFMLCGNPQMIKDTSVTLNSFGLERNRRAKPGNITVERYWL